MALPRRSLPSRTPYGFALVRNDRANVMRPLRFPAPPSSLPRLDRAPAAFAGLSGDVGKVIFLCMLVALGKVGIGKLPAFARDKALLWCVSGGHPQSFPRAVAKSSRCASSIAQTLRWQT